MGFTPVYETKVWVDNQKKQTTISYAIRPEARGQIFRLTTAFCPEILVGIHNDALYFQVEVHHPFSV